MSLIDYAASHDSESQETLVMPHRLLFSSAVLLTATGLTAQSGLIAKWEAKQKEPWFQGGGWVHDLDAAKARAAKENKVILAYFSRSYSP